MGPPRNSIVERAGTAGRITYIRRGRVNFPPYRCVRGLGGLEGVLLGDCIRATAVLLLVQCVDGAVKPPHGRSELGLVCNRRIAPS